MQYYGQTSSRYAPVEPYPPGLVVLALSLHTQPVIYSAEVIETDAQVRSSLNEDVKHTLDLYHIVYSALHGPGIDSVVDQRPHGP